MKRQLVPIVLAFLFIIPSSLTAQESLLPVVATTSLIADVARVVGGDLVVVSALVPPDTDVHAFQPMPQDVVIIEAAAVVLVNGAGLEAGLLQLVENAATVDATNVSAGITLRRFGDPADSDESCETEDSGEPDNDDHEPGTCDPHVWGDPRNVAIWADNIAAAFAAADPAHADTYRANVDSYRAELDALDTDLHDLFATIPAANRILVTNHDFLGYFAARYDFAIVGTVMPAASTLAEAAPQDIAALIEVIQREGVTAIFTEVADTSTLAQMIAADLGDIAVVPLYSGALSAPDGPAGTYLAYMRANAQMVVEVLSS